jgi:amino acid permease
MIRDLKTSFFGYASLYTLQKITVELTNSATFSADQVMVIVFFHISQFYLVAILAIAIVKPMDDPKLLQ